jgi:hypothetical protein
VLQPGGWWDEGLRYKNRAPALDLEATLSSSLSILVFTCLPLILNSLPQAKSTQALAIPLLGNLPKTSRARSYPPTVLFLSTESYIYPGILMEGNSYGEVLL